jgi:chromosomal replication initiator protein
MTGFLHALVEDAAREAGVSIAAILGPSKRREIAWPRMRSMARAHVDYGFSLPQIGLVFNRDHTTVLHAVRKFAE